MAQQIQLRRGTAAEWTTANTLLALGEIGYETDTKKVKIGDGVTTWNSLSYSGLGVSTNSPDSFLLNRANHTGTQVAATISDFNTAVAGQVTNKLTNPLTTLGDTIYQGAGGATRLPIGSTDQLLRVSGGIPSWQSENLTQDFGDGSDGNITVTGALTLSNNLYADTLTITAGAVLNPAGFQIYCKTLDLTNATTSGAIVGNGNNGTSVSANTAGAGGVALSSAVVGGGAAGGAGVAGGTGVGASGGAGGASSPGNGGSGGTSGLGGTGASGAGGAAAAGGAASNNLHLGRFEYQFLRGATQIAGGAGGRGGSTGAGDGTNSSRGSPGGGSGGRVVVIYAANIITSASTATGIVQAKGGNGGVQTNAPAAGNAGGASGGGGGGGGYIYLAYVTKTGPTVSNLLDASGGNGGNGSNGIGTGIGGAGSNGGSGGYIQTYNVSTNMGVQVVGGIGGTGTSASGVTAGVGGVGGSCVLSL